MSLAMVKLDHRLSHGDDVADLCGEAYGAAGAPGEDGLQRGFRVGGSGLIDVERDPPRRASLVVVVCDRHRNAAPGQVAAVEIATVNPPGQEALADPKSGA